VGADFSIQIKDKTLLRFMHHKNDTDQDITLLSYIDSHRKIPRNFKIELITKLYQNRKQVQLTDEIFLK